jgi:hypothetical protein
VCETGQQGRARAAADVQVTRGEGGSRRWSGSGLHSGGGEEQESRGVPEEEERRGGGLKGLCGNIKNLRDPTVKYDFMLIQNPNEEMTKIKVGEFFNYTTLL